MFKSFTDETNEFPTDETFKSSFLENHLSNQNAREILFCIALYQKQSPFSDVRKLSSSSYSVEHMMPIKWEDNWMPQKIDENGKVIRNKTLKTLGNLTLVRGRLNSKLSNAPWSQKRETLRAYSSLSITVDYLGEVDWNEDRILSRAKELFDKSAIKMWGYYS